LIWDIDTDITLEKSNTLTIYDIIKAII